MLSVLHGDALAQTVRQGDEMTGVANSRPEGEVARKNARRNRAPKSFDDDICTD